MTPPKGWTGSYAHRERRRTAYNPFTGMILQIISDRIMVVGFPDAIGGHKLVFISFAMGDLYAEACTPEHLLEAIRKLQAERENAAKADRDMEDIPIT